MNKNVLIAFGGAALIALVVALMLNAMLKGGGHTEKAENIATTQILVATHTIDVGEVLSSDNMKWKAWPKDSLFPGTVERSGDAKPLDALKGRVVQKIESGQPILKSAVVKNKGGFMAAMLKPGDRAVAIKVSAQTMAGGFIKADDYVDVILTYRSRISYQSADKEAQTGIQDLINQNLSQYATETVLQNIKVIGIDQKAIKEGGTTSGKVAKTVTLEVTPRQAEKLALAEKMGDLSLALRSLGDEKIVTSDKPALSDARISKIYKEIRTEIDQKEAQSGARRFNVRINNGGDVSIIPVR